MSELFSLSVTADDAPHHPLTSLGSAAIAQLGERQTEDLKVPGSIPGLGMLSCLVGQPLDDCTSLALFWMLQGTGLGCGAVARG